MLFFSTVIIGSVSGFCQCSRQDGSLWLRQVSRQAIGGSSGWRVRPGSCGLKDRQDGGGAVEVARSSAIGGDRLAMEGSE